MMDKVEAHRCLFRFMKQEMPLYEFEQWLYQHTELENLLGVKEYLEFISRDYHHTFSFHECETQIRRLIDPAAFEQERLVELLRKLAVSDDQSLEVMKVLYEEYGSGFTFLRYIALVFITTSDEHQTILGEDKTKLASYLVPIAAEAKRLLSFFENHELLVTSENDYLDNRQQADRIELHSINEMLGRTESGG
ncbi:MULTISPECIES: hypothetical protein [Paenibacillus]|uniref:hypothetical protein n=1 Tax=Paenibacillus TaxID=44249 RepID=UPI0022B89326|nr:hypothetical protein [Paenibacillus caseinilyticus]MCZ8518531.1 hypothetical protein [Paenibacillus caseinilyticus]